MKSLSLKSLVVFLFFAVIIAGASTFLGPSIISIGAAMPSATVTGGGNYCLNEPNVQVTFTGSGGTGAGEYTFNYRINNGTLLSLTTTGNSTTITLPYSTANLNTSIYRLESVSFGGGAPMTINNESDIFRTIPRPNADFSFMNDQCSGAPINFTNLSTTGADVTYLWNFGDGESSTDFNPTHVFEALGCATEVFNVQLQVTRNGCTVSQQIPITVRQAPELLLSDIDEPFDPFNNCSGFSSATNYTININDATVDACVSNKRIDWGDGTFDNNPTFPLSHTYTTTGAFNLRFIGDADNGCIAEKVYIVKNVSNPQGGLISPGTTQNLCAPTPQLLFEISNWGNNSADTQYTINYGDGTPSVIYTQIELEASAFYNSSDPENSNDFPVPYAYLESNCPVPSYTVTLDIENACGSTQSTVGGITVLSPPEADFTAPPAACVDTSVTFNNLTDSGFSQNCNTDAIFTWDFGDGSPTVTTAPSQPEDISHVYTTPGTYDVSLTAQGFCGSDTMIRSICIEPELVPAISYSADEGCTDFDVAVTNTTDTNDICSNLTYNWTVTYADDFCETGSGDFSYINGTDQNSLAPEFNFIQPGRYTIGGTITGSSCGNVSIPEQEILVKQPPQVTIDPIDSLCEGDGMSINPTATVESCTIASGTVTYAWTFPGGTPSTSTTADPGTIAYPTTGDYTVSLEVTNECGTTTATDVIFTISEDPVISGNLTECEGETEQLSAAGTPATANPWSSADATIAMVDATGLVTAVSPGLVDITFTNDNGCTNTVSFEVTPGPTVTTQPLVDQEICIGGTATTLSVAFTNGNGTTSYQWYENITNSTVGGTAIAGATSPSFDPDTSAIGERFYYVIVSFTVGCPTIISDVARVEVTPPPTITTQPQTVQELCVGGTIDPLVVTIQDGAGTPTYQWFSNITNSNTGGTAIVGANAASYIPPTFTISGTFYYYAEIDFAASGCGLLNSDVAEVIVADDPVIDSQPLATQELCQTTTAAALNITASGGLGTLNYQWFQNATNSNTGGTAIVGANIDTYQPLTNTVGTQYYYVVVDQAGLDCTVTSNTAEVIVVPAPAIATQPQSEEYCEGDTINTLTVIAANGSGTPSYQWFENTTDSNVGGTAVTGATTASFTPLATLGNSYYYVEVSYATGGCSQIASNVATISIDEAPVVADDTLTICSGDPLSYIPDPASPNVVDVTTIYTWTLPVINPVGTITGATAQATPQLSVDQQLTNITNMPATATYTITPQTGNCIGTSFELTVEVLPKPEVIFSESDQTICNGSTSTAVNLTSNFTNNISFEWTAIIPAGITGATTSGTDIISAQTLTNSTATALTVIYSAKAIFLNGTSSCEGIEQVYSITVQPEINATGVISDINGFGVSAAGATDGTIDLTVSGGSGNFTYSWTGPNGFTATAEDLTGLAAGDYQVSIDDGVCAPVVLDFQLTSPPELLASEDLSAHRDLTCFGDNDGIFAIVITQESVGPYGYELINENGIVIFTNLDSTDLRQEFIGLTAGTYNVRITDGNDAAKTFTGFEILQPTEIIITATITPITCFNANDATITLNVTGGAGGYTASWSNLATGFFQDNLAADNYVITVTDASGCTSMISIEIEEASVFFTAPTFSNVSCFGANDGSIELNLTGGVAPVNLIWSDGSTQGTTRNNLGPGTYTATISESSVGSCSIVETFTIIEPQELVLDSNVTNVLDCNNPNAGAIDLLISGGNGPFTYNWSTGETTEDLTGITSGNYQVTVTDANGCSSNREITVTGATPIDISIIDQLDVDCETGVISQMLTAVVSGGVAPYTIQWSSGTISGPNGETTTTDQNGLVILTVTDAIGCERSTTFDVSLEPLGQASFTSDSFAFRTYGDYSIQDPIEFTDLSTGTPLSISWNFGDGSFSDEINPTHVYVTPGQYTVVQTVTYDYGCTQTFIVTLNVTKGYKLVMPNAFTPNGDKLNDLFRPSQEGLEELQFTVYDSWGSLIYSEEGEIIAGWNGEMNNRNTENGNFYFKFIAMTFYGKEIVAEGTFTKID